MFSGVGDPTGLAEIPADRSLFLLSRNFLFRGGDKPSGEQAPEPLLQGTALGEDLLPPG
jgi:hypothetical protein